MRKAPASTIGDLAEAMRQLFEVETPVQVIGIRHGEKMYEALASAEELRRSEDMGDFLRVHMDGRDLNYNKFFTEGEQEGGTVGGAEVTALYGHYFRRFWDVVVGYRQDIEPTAQGYLAFGVTGLAPYWFEFGALGFISHQQAVEDLEIGSRWHDGEK